MPSTSRISPPLPLPIGFTLLPSRLPGQPLTPLLYTTVNGLPIYLTLSPSHTPHVSFLPLILALKVPHTPLSLLVEYSLGPNQHSLDVNGIAPWADLWISLETARHIIRDLGASRLFWDEQGRGLLGKVGDAVSWEEARGWHHNWLPAKSHLPSSSYSLDSLLGRTWSFIEIIPDDRCVFTPAGKQRTARLRSEALSEDHSCLRSGMWGPAWEAILGWTIQSWAEYRLSPSKLASTPRRTRRRRAYPVIDLLNTLPALFGGQASSPTSLDPSDLARLAPSLRSAPNIASTAYQLLLAILRTTTAIVPALIHLAPSSLVIDANPIQAQWRARVQLALCSLLSEIVLGIWRFRRDNDRLRAALASKGDSIPADISITPAREKVKPPSRPTSSTSSEELDVLVELERRRGESPLPPDRPRRERFQGKRAREAVPQNPARRGGSPLPPDRPRRTRFQGKRARKPVPQKISSDSSSSENVKVAGRPAYPPKRSDRFRRAASSTVVDERHAKPGRKSSVATTDDAIPVHQPTQSPIKIVESGRIPDGSSEPHNPEMDHVSHESDQGDQPSHVRPQSSPGDGNQDHHPGFDRPAPELGNDAPDGDEEQEDWEATDESVAGSVVQSLDHKRRIHPWSTAIFSLLAVIAAYIVLLNGGPSTSAYG